LQANKRGGVSTIQDALESFLRSSGLNRRAGVEQAFAAWRKALGVRLARRARPVRFRDGELTVEVDSSAHFQELSSFTGETFRKKANRAVGGELIRSVNFKLRG